MKCKRLRLFSFREILPVLFKVIDILGSRTKIGTEKDVNVSLYLFLFWEIPTYLLLNNYKSAHIITVVGVYNL